MSDEKTVASDIPTLRPIPENLPEELLPLYDWWKTNGLQFVATLVAAAVLGGSVFAFKQYRAAKIAGANQELMKASSLEDLEAVVAKYGTTKAGNAARLRLAKAYYDAAKYEDALAAYDTCLGKGAPAGFGQIAELGRAQALEALGRTEEAMTAFQAFSKAHEDHFLQPYAVMGEARILALQGKKDEAKKRLENLKAKVSDAPGWEMTIASLEGVITRYEPRAARSLFDAANEAVKKADAPAAPAPAPAK